MRRFVPRAILSAALVISAAACAAGTATSGGSAGGAGGRYQVMIPNPTTQGGVSQGDAERVANLLRRQVSDMVTHTAVDGGVIRNAMRQYEVESLNSTTARQLAQQIGAQNVLYVEMAPGGSGLQAEGQFIDVASGDVIEIPTVSGSDANELAAAIFAGVESGIEGIRQAAACNDYLSSQQYERALETCENALTVVPTSSSALYGKATALLQLERYEESLQTYETLLAQETANQDALLGAGLAASNLDRTDEALAFYNRYMELDPGNVQVRMTIAGEIATTGDYVSAYEVLAPVMNDAEYREDPEFQTFLFSLATAAGQRVSTEQDEAAARPYFETALEAYERAFTGPDAEPDVAQVRQAIAVNIGLGRTDEALDMARQATVQFDTVASVWNQYASALVQAERHAEAAEAFSRVIDLDPNYENAYIRRGMAYLEAGQRQQGLADLERAAQQGNREQVAQVLFSEANKLNNENRFDDAARLFEQAANYASGDLAGQARFFQGFMYFRQGDAIARANGTGNVAEARRALELFQRARPLIEAGTNAQKQQVLDGIDQYIANQEAIIRAGSR